MRASRCPRPARDPQDLYQKGNPVDEQTVPQPVGKRAELIGVGDRILPEFLPSPYFREPGEVVFVKVHDYRKGRYVFLAYVQDNGFYDSTSYDPDGYIEVYPADTGLGYSRADDGETTQNLSGRVPSHHEDARTGEVFEVQPGVLPAGTPSTWVDGEDPVEIVHWRSSGLLRMVIACGSESGLHSADLVKVTCRACLKEAF
jgi:hypothetical protein